MVTFSHGGYVKSQPLADYRAQRRGGRGKKATTMKEDDFIERLFVAHSHDYLLCFSNRGRSTGSRCTRCRGQPHARGKPIVNMFPLRRARRSPRCVPVKEFDEDHYRVHGDRAGHREEDRARPSSRARASGIIAVGLDEGDYLIGAALTDGKYDVMLFSDGARRCASRRATCGRWAARRAACAACGSAKASR